MASCTSVVCLPDKDNIYSIACRRRGDLLSVSVGPNGARSTFQCGHAVDPTGLPGELQQQLSTLLRSGWTCLVVYVAAATQSNQQLSAALTSTLEGAYQVLSTVQQYAATVYIAGQVLEGCSGNPRYQGTCPQEAGSWLASCLAPSSSAAADGPAASTPAVLELRFSSNLAPGDVLLLVFQPTASEQGMQQLGVLQDLLIQLQRSRFSDLTAPEGSCAEAWLPCFQGSHSLLLLVDLAADSQQGAVGQQQLPGPEQELLCLLMQLAQNACSEALPLQLQEALAALSASSSESGSGRSRQRTVAAGAGAKGRPVSAISASDTSGPNYQEQALRSLSAQVSQLQSELERTHVHYTGLLDRLAGSSWQQNAAALDRSALRGRVTISRQGPGGPSAGATLRASMTEAGDTLRLTSRAGSPHRGSSPNGRTMRPGSASALSNATVGRASPDAHTQLLMSQIESLRRALTAAEERESVLEAEAVALQEAGSSRVSALMLEAKRITAKMQEAQQQAADREAQLAAQVRELTEQLSQQHERLTANAEAARTEAAEVAKQLPDAVISHAGLSTLPGSRPGSAQPRARSPAVQTQTNKATRSLGDAEPPSEKEQLESLLQQQRAKTEAVEQQLALAQGQLSRARGLQEHGVPLLWQSALVLNQLLAALDPVMGLSQQKGGFRAWAPSEQVLPINWTPDEAAMLQQQLQAAQICLETHPTRQPGLDTAAAGHVLQDQGTLGRGAATGTLTSSSSRPGSGRSPSPSRLRPGSASGLTHSLTSGKSLPAVAAAAAVAAGMVDSRPSWVLSGKALGRPSAELQQQQQQLAGGMSGSRSRPSSAAAAGSRATAAVGGAEEVGGTSSRPTSASRSSTAAQQPGSPPQLLAYREDQVSGDLLAKLQHRIEAQVLQQLAAKGHRGVQQLRSEPSSPTPSPPGTGRGQGGDDLCSGDTGAGSGLEVQQYISKLEADVERYRQQLQQESKRNQELLHVVRRNQAAEGAAAAAYMSSMSLAGPCRSPSFTTGYGGATQQLPLQRPASAPARRPTNTGAKTGDAGVLTAGPGSPSIPAGVLGNPPSSSRPVSATASSKKAVRF